MVPFLHRAAPRTIEENPLWLVVLCDMMTNLMLFFLVMYAFTRQPEESRRKFVEGLNSTLEESRRDEGKVEALVQQFQEKEASSALRELFRKAGLSDLTEVELSEKQIRVRLASPVLFASGGVDLSSRAKGVLDPVGKLLATLPNEVVVEGYTDNLPIMGGAYRSNWELSVARATSVVRHLLRRFPISEKRFVVAGYGEFKPVDSNTTSSGRGRNRRIEIVILRK